MDIKQDRIMHYTNIPALYKIIDTGELLATHIGYLNDSMEQKEFLKIAKTDEFINNVLNLPLTGNIQNHEKKIAEKKTLDPLTENQKQIWIDLCNKLDKFNSRSRSQDDDEIIADVYIISFTTLYDDLSQWRSYAGGTNGCCIVFNKTQYEEIFSNELPTLRKTIYYNQSTFEEFYKTFNENEGYGPKLAYQFRKFCSKICSNKTDSDTEPKPEIEFYNYINVLSSIIKNYSFNNENELREIILAKKENIPKFIEKNNLNIPRISSINNLEKKLEFICSIKEVYIGFNDNFKNIFTSIKFTLLKKIIYFINELNKKSNQQNKKNYYYRLPTTKKDNEFRMKVYGPPNISDQQLEGDTSQQKNKKRIFNIYILLKKTKHPFVP